MIERGRGCCMDDEYLLRGLAGEGGAYKQCLLMSVHPLSDQSSISWAYIFVFIIVLTSEVAS